MMPTLSKKKFQVFVSSTYNDLQEERQEAVSAILKAGHIPAGMELFTAGNKSQFEVIKKWIDESDMYMLILGTRYGAIEPISKLSYTEAEYEYALSVGKPIFSIVLNDSYRDTKLKALGSVAAENSDSAGLEKFRTKVMDKMCSIVREIKDIKGAVYENLIEITSSHDLVGWVSAFLVEDVNDLRATLSTLERENEKLQIELDKYRLNTSNLDGVTAANSSKFNKLDEILQKEVILPADASKDGKEAKRSVIGMLISNRNLLVRGWSILRPASSTNKWFDEEILPDLLIHRLITKTQIQNGSRYEMTDKGLDFLAWKDGQKGSTPKDGAEPTVKTIKSASN